MRVDEAKQQVLDLAFAQLENRGIVPPIESDSPDPNDPGKFVLQNRAARAIHRFDGWHVPVNSGWFSGDVEPPEIHSFPFYWYAFAIPKYGGFDQPSYFICDYLQVRSWALEFDSPQGVDYQDQSTWRADFRPYGEGQPGRLAYFRWGDEPIEELTRLERVIKLDNILDIVQHEVRQPGVEYRPESEAHLRLKHFIASNPDEIGLTEEFKPTLEREYLTGDHVDVEFESPDGQVVVVEIELEGEANLLVGVHQAIKYRALAQSHRGIPKSSDQVKAILVAFDTGYEPVRTIARKYDVQVVRINPDRLLP